MELIIGKNSSFCYGVKRAVEGAKKEAKDGSIYCLGEIVHNSKVVSSLKEKGVIFVDDIKDVNMNSKVIFRAHGVKKEVYKYAKEKNIKIIDYTCPNVLKIHKLIEKYQNENYYIFLIGVKFHPETLASESFCNKENYSLITCIEELKDSINRFKKVNNKKLAIICQTTYNLDQFKLIIKIINSYIDDYVDIKIENTICNATKIRQEEAYNISKNVDKMIIIGGSSSSNTKKLYDISTSQCEKCFLVEDEKQLNEKDFNVNDKVGIVAGASTPKESIDRIVSFLNKIK